MPVRQLLDVPRLDPSTHRGRPASPRVDQEALQHPAEGSVAPGDLDHLAHVTGAYVIEVPPDKPFALDHRAPTQRPMARFASRLLEQPGERARVVFGLKRVALRDGRKMREHLRGVELALPQADFLAVE